MSNPNPRERSAPPLESRDHIRGSVTATIILMEYGSFPCPGSIQAYPTVKALCRRLSNQLCFVYRHFPQSEIWPSADKAACSAEAAGSQGKFWEMHDLLFEQQQSLNDSVLVEYAVNLGLDIPRFLQELANRVHIERVQADIESAKKYGVQETPTFFISVRHQGTQNLEVMLQQILNVVSQFS